MTGKNKEQFEKWLLKFYRGNDRKKPSQRLQALSFTSHKFEMQIGVYLAYYENIVLINAISYDNQFYWKAICNHELNKRHDTRNEAYKEAFKQADKLINKEL